MDKIKKPLTEAKYLNADNADRYRSIMRIFYMHYEQLRPWMYLEDVYMEMMKDPYFADYKKEQCQQDLNALTEWKNLTTTQDLRKVTTIEEFKNKKFRYQMSAYSVEIERLMIRLENLLIEGASLEPTLLEQIRGDIEKLLHAAEEAPEEVHYLWNNLNNDFRRLNQNYQDYNRDLNSVKAEEMMQSKEFLLFKDKLIEYLRSFIKGLHKNAGVIEELLKNLDENTKNKVLDKVVKHEMSIPRFDNVVTSSQLMENNQGKYDSIYRWFVGENGQENEAGKLFDKTNEIIRRITRYAAQISEKNASSANRKEEYKKVAETFLACEHVNQAHQLSAMVFGLESPKHFRFYNDRSTDSMNQSVFEEQVSEIVLKPRVRTYREKTTRTSIADHKAMKEEAKQKLIEQAKIEKQKLLELEVDGKIDFGHLPVIEPRVREILLKWLSDALGNNNQGRTEDGRQFVVKVDRNKEKCVVRCEDGIFTMPHMHISFITE